MGKTVLFGGTFNPLHIGHLEMLEELNSRPEVKEILLLPDSIPPHKACEFLATDEDRINMCALVAEDIKKARVCLIEFERSGKSYSFDTVTLLKKKYPKKNFVFAIGGDMLTTLDEWYNYEQLIKEVPFYAFKREGISELLFDTQLNNLLKMGADITVIDKKIKQVSSTVIRSNPEKHKKLLPKKVYAYIKARRLYREG